MKMKAIVFSLAFQLDRDDPEQVDLCLAWMEQGLKTKTHIDTYLPAGRPPDCRPFLRFARLPTGEIDAQFEYWMQNEEGA